MDRPGIEITYVYPNRYMYWTTRQNLTQGASLASNSSNLGRKMVLHATKSEGNMLSLTQFNL